MLCNITLRILVMHGAKSVIIHEMFMHRIPDCTHQIFYSSSIKGYGTPMGFWYQ